jgi:hypothetical protein
MVIKTIKTMVIMIIVMTMITMIMIITIRFQSGDYVGTPCRKLYRSWNTLQSSPPNSTPSTSEGKGAS